MTSPREGFDHGRFFAAYDVAHVVRMFDLTGQLLHEVQGCEGNIGNAEELQRADPQRFFFRPFMHDVAFGADTVLYHFSPTADDGYHRLERYTTDGKRLEPTLVPGRERGGAYLGGVVPVGDSAWDWAYNHLTGTLYRMSTRRGGG